MIFLNSQKKCDRLALCTRNFLFSLAFCELASGNFNPCGCTRILKPILISGFIKMKHNSVFLGPQVSGIDAGSKKIQNSYLSSCHFALVLQLDKEGYSTCTDQYFPSKDEQTSRFFGPAIANMRLYFLLMLYVVCFIAILNLRSADTFFQGIKAIFRT